MPDLLLHNSLRCWSICQLASRSAIALISPDKRNQRHPVERIMQRGLRRPPSTKLGGPTTSSSSRGI
jgi:hypothetical protein